MEHTEARELLELAAVEPQGFERLMAGDTSDAAALAGHLAGCDECAEEMLRLRRAAGIIRDVVRTTPPADLRDRTLAFVRDVGRDRGGRVAAGMGESAPAAPPIVATGPQPAMRPTAGPLGRGSFGRPAWFGAIAAVLVVSVVATALVVRSQSDDQLRRQQAVAEQLGRVTSWYVGIEAQSDAQKVTLTSPSGADASGTIEFSATSGQLVVVANGLTEPSGNQQLSCWIEVDGNRRAIGRMSFGGGISYWAGRNETLGSIAAGTKFGVSLPGGDPVLIGQL
jgi:hypothetical protein